MIGKRIQILRVCSVLMVISMLLAVSSAAQESTVIPPVHTVVSPDPLFNEIRSEMLGTVEHGELPSLAVGVIYEGRIVWEEAFGWADKENNVPATTSTPYGLASVGKSITATGVMTLVEQGRITLDDPIEHYIAPAKLTMYEGAASDVTVRRLLNMTAAIPHGNLDFLSEVNARDYATSDIVSNRGIVVFSPGEVFLYSNFSYGILEHLIECVSGVKYSRFLKMNVFTPLGMEHALVGKSAEPAKLTVARYGKDGSRLSETYPVPQSSRAIHASVHDLIRYAQFHLKSLPSDEQQILTEAILDTMHYERPDLKQSLMALGWGSIDLGDGLIWLLTNGRDGGAQATISLIPSKSLAVICLTNKTGNRTDEIAFRITDLLMPGFLTRVMNRISDYEAWADRPFKPTPDLLGDWEGRVRTPKRDLHVTMSFHDNGDIYIDLDGTGRNLLTGVRLKEGFISGQFVGKIPLEETSVDPHEIGLALIMKDDRLFGYATAVFSNTKGRYSLPAYVSLLPKRTPDIKE